MSEAPTMKLAGWRVDYGRDCDAPLCVWVDARRRDYEYALQAATRLHGTVTEIFVDASGALHERANAWPPKRRFLT